MLLLTTTGEETAGEVTSLEDSSSRAESQSTGSVAESKECKSDAEHSEKIVEQQENQ